MLSSLCFTIPFTFLISFLLLLLLPTHTLSSITSVTLLTSTSSLPMFQNSSIQPLFLNTETKFNCALPNIYIYQQTSSQFLSNTPYQIQITTNNTTLYNITSSTLYNNFVPTLSPNSCTSNCTLSISNNCPNILTNQNYFDILTINISNLPSLTYRIDCDTLFSPFSFQWGLFVLIIMMTVLIFVSSYFSRSESYDGFGITLGYWVLAGVGCVVLLGGILGVYYMSGVNRVVEGVCWVLGVISVGVCCGEILFLCSWNVLNKPLFNFKNLKWKYLRLIELISFIIGLLFTTAWWLTDKNWILNDILSCCIIITCTQLLKFTSLRMATHYFTCILLIQIIVALVLYFYYNQAYNIVLLNSFNNPLEIQFPSITKAIDLKCSWLPITEIIFPAIFISYMRRFDKSRQGHVYIVISSITFFFGCIAWAILDAFIEIPVPLGLFIEPILLFAVLLSSLKRNEIKVIWFGRFYDMDYKDCEDFRRQMRSSRYGREKREGNENVERYGDGEGDLGADSKLFKGLRVGEERDSSLGDGEGRVSVEMVVRHSMPDTIQTQPPHFI